MTRRTNGHVQSAVHRVVNATVRRRYSIPQFHHRNYRVVVDPPMPLADEAAHFEALTVGESVASAFRRDRKSWRTEASADNGFAESAVSRV